MANSRVQKRKQERLVIWGGVLIIVTSVVMTLWVSGALFKFDSSGGYKNVTFTDALLACQKQSRELYEGKLQRLVTDDHSSRYDNASNRYKIFFDATMSSQKSASGSKEFYINCFVNADGGRISGYDTYEQKENTTEAIRQDKGGLFGWPLK